MSAARSSSDRSAVIRHRAVGMRTGGPLEPPGDGIITSLQNSANTKNVNILSMLLTIVVNGTKVQRKRITRRVPSAFVRSAQIQQLHRQKLS